MLKPTEFINYGFTEALLFAQACSKTGLSQETMQKLSLPQQTLSADSGSFH